MIYDTDTAHCEGNGCEKKETCLRYALHKIRERMKGAEWIAITYIFSEDCTSDNYQMYKEDGRI